MHQPGHPVLATGHPEFLEVVMDLAVAIDPAALQPGLLDQSQQPLVLAGTARLRGSLPGVLAAGVDSHHSAQATHGVQALVGLDKCVPYPDTLAKYAAAFFRMSRSSVTRFKS